MSALTTPPAAIAGDLGRSRAPAGVPDQTRRRRRRQTPATRYRRQIGRRVATAALLVGLAGSLLLAVPALRPVLHEVRHINPLWIVAAVGLELASCVSFVTLFRAFFDRLQGRDARPLAWANMASGALLPGGGVGGMAIGGWLMHLTGASTRWIVRRSGGLFFLTSAVNAATVIGAGLLLSAGVARPVGFLLAGLPVLIVTVATTAVLVAAHRVHGRPRTARGARALAAGVLDAERTTFEHPSWRLLGALGYLGFDMAVLWVSLAAVGHPISIPALVLAYNIGYLANSLPVPGGIGVLDAGLAGALVLYGAPAAQAAAAVLIYHTIALWIPGLGGLLAYTRVRPRLTVDSDAPDEDDPHSGGAQAEPVEGAAKHREITAAITKLAIKRDGPRPQSPKPTELRNAPDDPPSR